ncbi:MAG TPA: HlyD family secretion protein [Bryobacteraceae bacterium]|jgi:membrane fusion protein (multidrug efflux system)|nr:HlyD family secretion protein [Bryobacteraceae bacterium]
MSSPGNPNPAPPSPPPVTKGRGRAFLIFFIFLLIAAGVGLYFYLQSRQFESTDDAEVEAHLNSISSRVDGSITHVYVDNNQIVKAGDPLVDLDPRDYQVAIDQVRAQVAQARSQVTALRPNVPITQIESSTNIAGAEADVANAEAAVGVAERDRETAAARLAEAEANAAKAKADLSRYTLLIKNEEISQQEFDQVAATAKAQDATVDANRAAVQAAAQTVVQRQAQLMQVKTRLGQYQRNAPAQLAIREANVQSQQANQETSQAMLEEAELKLGYTKIVAPAAGIVLKRSAELGERISAGQQLLMIAQINDLWVTANFKETQMHNIHAGQAARLHVDALRQDFDGYVETIGGSTGAIASVLPPENATGNYVKVVQRIPVRLRFKPNQNGLDRLRPGMSVEPEVRIGS